MCQHSTISYAIASQGPVRFFFLKAKEQLVFLKRCLHPRRYLSILTAVPRDNSYSDFTEVKIAVSKRLNGSPNGRWLATWEFQV